MSKKECRMCGYSIEHSAIAYAITFKKDKYPFCWDCYSKIEDVKRAFERMEITFPKIELLRSHDKEGEKHYRKIIENMCKQGD